MPKVITIWELAVKLKGTSPERLKKRIRKNRVRKWGKYFNPFKPDCSLTKEYINW